MWGFNIVVCLQYGHLLGNDVWSTDRFYKKDGHPPICPLYTRIPSLVSLYIYMHYKIDNYLWYEMVLYWTGCTPYCANLPQSRIWRRCPRCKDTDMISGWDTVYIYICIYIYMYIYICIHVHMYTVFVYIYMHIIYIDTLDMMSLYIYIYI